MLILANIHAEKKANWRFALQVDRRGWVVLGFFPFAAVIILNLVRFFPSPSATIISVFSFLQLTLLLKQFPIVVKDGTLDLEQAAFLSSLVAIGPFWSVFNCFIGILWYEWFVKKTLPDRKRIWQNLFNIENTLITAGAAAILYGLLEPVAGSCLALFVAGAIAPMVNRFQVSVYFAVLDRVKVFDVWNQEEESAVQLICLAYIPIGFLLGKLFFVSPLLMFLFIPPLICLWHFSKLTFQVKQEADIALQVMGDILEERDEYTFGHTLRVADYAEILARDLGLPPAQIELCIKAARIHDIGKIAVHDEVLKKEGSLTTAEYDHIKEHVRIIPRLFRHMDRFGKLLHLAMLHHERYDGLGYPIGLKGEEIPLIVRIISVADAWDAMTSTRVYRKAMSWEKAAEILRQGSGTNWDPVLVSAFLSSGLPDPSASSPTPPEAGLELAAAR